MFNGSIVEAEKYFVNNVFNIGSVDDNIQKCYRVELLSENKETFSLELDRQEKINKEIARLQSEFNPSILFNELSEIDYKSKYEGLQNKNIRLKKLLTDLLEGDDSE